MSGKFIVLNFKKTIGALVIISILTIISAISLKLANTMIETGSPNRLLPIYSVDTSKNQVALTFDCAWSRSQLEKIT